MLRRIWNKLAQPSVHWSLGGLLFSGLVVGVLFSVAFEYTMEATNTEGFCSDSCHEMTRQRG